MTAPTPKPSIGQEPPMFLQRPSSARSQDVTHVLARTFRQLFTRDTISNDTIDNLHKSRGGEDEYHEKYVEALKKIQEERDRRMSEAAMLERHIMQAQARAMSADERELNRVSSGYQRFPDLGLPPARSHFRSCIDSHLLRQHNLITPEDFATEESPPVPAPKASEIPSYARQTHTSSQKKGREVDRESHSAPLPPIPGGNDPSSYVYEDSGSDEELQDTKRPSVTASANLEQQRRNVWKKQLNPERREVERSDLALLQAKVDYLKNPRHIPPSAPGGGRTLVRQSKRKPKELGIKPKPEKESKEPSVVFVPSPEVIRFTEYNVGQVYEMTLELKNVSTVMRPVRVIPPATTYFSSGLGQFPGEQGLVAPGMSCHYTIRFAPDSLGDFDDEVQVQTQSSTPLVIKLEGRREPPVLSLSSEINVGHCLIGGTKMCQFQVKNTGGSGRFCLMPRSAWPAANFKTIASSGHVQLPPFEIRPSVFELGKNDTTILQVIFKPQSVEQYSQDITMVCDNCQIQHFKVIGEGEEAGVTLDTVDGGVGEYLPGEAPDVTAEHLVRFEDLNPYTYVQRKISVKNSTHVELPYTWLVVKPFLEPLDPSSTEVTIPSQRIQDVNSGFSIEPESGVLPPDGLQQFTVMFAPPEVKNYHSVLHMVLRDIPKSSSNACSNESEQKPSKEVVADVGPAKSNLSESGIFDMTSMEIEVKGKCVPLNVLLQPYAIYIPGKTMVETPVKKHFRMANSSLSTIFFEWENLNNSRHVIQVEPAMGELGPQTAADMEVTVSSSVPGKVCHTLKCHVQHLSVPLYLPVQADIKGPEVHVDHSDVNFGLVRFGEQGKQTMVIQNMCQVPACWSLRESPAVATSTNPMAMSEFKFSPETGELGPLETQEVTVTFTPTSCRSVRTVFEVQVEDGNECNVAVRAEVQQPAVCLRSCELAMEEVYLGVPKVQQVELINQTLLATSYEWGEVEGPQVDLVDVSVEPRTGPLQPREELKLSLTFTPHTQGELSDLRIPCRVEGMDNPIYLTLICEVKGLTVSYRTAAEPNMEPCPDSDLKLCFGEDCEVGSNPKRYVYIKNNSAMCAPFNLTVEHFNAKPPSPPERKLAGTAQPSKRRPLLNKTQNLADPSSRTASRAHADMCGVILKDGRGAAFTVQPASGILQPFADQQVEVTGFSNMWGHYTDRLICKVESLEPVYIPMEMTVSGCPLRFQMVAANSTQKPILRFGTHVSGLPPVTRQMRINNSSPFDIRVDWQMYDVHSDDQQLIDFVVAYGDPFPLKDAEGNELIVSEEGPLKPERLPTDFIPNSEETTPAVSTQVTARDDGSTPLVEQRPDVVKVYIRVHDGVQSEDNYSISPSQLVIPAKGNSCINVSFTPQPGVSEGEDCIGYALGYMSLHDHVSHVENKVKRKQAYEVSPIRLDMTAHVKPALLRMECSDDEGMRFRTAASDLLHQGEMLPSYLSMNSVVLSNTTETPLTFRIMTSEPFQLVDLDPVTRQPTAQLLQTNPITLRQRENMKVHVAFQVSLDLLTYLESLDKEDEEEAGVTLERLGEERRLSFKYNMVVQFQNKSEQTLPLYATLAVPSLVLSKEELDFGTCLVGQQREMELTITNPTTSATFWTASLERKSTACTNKTFVLSPSNGLLEAHTSHVSNNKILIKVNFTGKHTEDYEAVFLFHGMLGEEPRRLTVRGQGSYDGKHEALVNV